MVVEAVQKTLQRIIYSHITEHEDLRYINHLQRLVKRYNNTVHGKSIEV